MKAKLNWGKCNQMQMLQTLAPVRAAKPCFMVITSLAWLRNLKGRARVRAFSFSSSDDDYGDQSRGGLPRDEFWHMTKVLRLGADDRVELFNGKGGLVEGCIQNIDRTGLDFVALNDPKLIHPQNMQFHVFAGFGTLKGGRADWLVEKCTVCFTSMLRFYLIGTGQRLHEMVLKPPVKVNDLLHLIAQSKLSLVATAKASPVLNALTEFEKETSGLIVIGPEGDFTEKEESMMMEAGAIGVSLGPHRLRVETATIALLSTLVLWSDSHRS
ncbi:hypothetical protein Ahy_A09g042242 isoform B [Arachis hypogaea]|uniref:16S rRNA (uracil(1498)-N(3))-methyltransferase n=1 Tax=Arachis hypogaea TaxID=3818 RepID=A0A445BF80_ARAHY|nr:hypothetical protein Ahy_A09g042242 isoform B [Arachis hypogaea]